MFHIIFIFIIVIILVTIELFTSGLDYGFPLETEKLQVSTYLLDSS